jgi:hypothetical protein
VNVNEVVLKPVVAGPVADEGRMDGMGAVPVLEKEGDELVLLP